MLILLAVTLIINARIGRSDARDFVGDVSVKVRTTYRVILPAGFEPGQKRAIFLAVHGYGMTHVDFARMLRKHFAKDFVMVIPDAPHPHIDKHDQKKTVYAWFAQSRYTEYMGDAARQIDKTIKLVEQRFKLQRAPIIIFGYSQGGAIAFATAGILHRRIAAVITYGGWLSAHQRKLVDPKVYRGKYVLVARGGADKRLDVGVVNNTVSILRSNGARLTYKVFAGLRHRPYGGQLECVAEWARKTARTLLGAAR